MSPKRQRIYLAYGSNLHPRRLEARVGAVRLLGSVRLPGWSLRFDKRGGDGSSKANLHATPHSDTIAWAAAYALRSDQVGRLDQFEGCGHGYEALPISIKLDSEPVVAFTYLAPAHWISQDLLPFDWYVDLIVSGATHHGFDASYVREITRQDVCADPDHRRARWQLGHIGLTLPMHYKR